MANLNEDLKRYKQLLGYDPKIGGASINEKRYHSYAEDTEGATEEEGAEEEETTEEEGAEENTDFDFGGEEGGEEEATDEGDEFGTADEFSAADELETEDDEVEEIDVTDIVKRADDAKGYSEKAVKAAEEGKNMIQDLMSKFDALQTSLSKIDTVANELNVIKADIQSQKPKEKLELRSLDSYPFNVKLTDYWDDEKLKDNYEITSRKPDGKSSDGDVKVWKLNPQEVKDYSATDIKKSFMPESKSKKRLIESFGELSDYLKSNCRSWEYDADNEDDTMKLANHLKEKFPDLNFDRIYSIASDWTGYEPKEADE